jgi:hypothetical protein
MYHCLIVVSLAIVKVTALLVNVGNYERRGVAFFGKGEGKGEGTCSEERL